MYTWDWEHLYFRGVCVGVGVDKAMMHFLHSRLFYKWTTGENRPPSGTLMQLVTADGKTETTPML